MTDSSLPIQIRPIIKNDLREITALHIRSFPESLMTRLGWEVVQKYYEWLMLGPHESFSAAAVCEGHLAGYLFGGRYTKATAGFIRKNKYYLLLRMLCSPGILGCPDFRMKISKGFRALLGRSPQVAGYKFQKSFGILAIASDPKLRGRGIGTRLMIAAAETARLRGFERMHLSVHPGNEGALIFYEKLGWQKVLSKSGKWDGLLWISLQEESGRHES